MSAGTAEHLRVLVDLAKLYPAVPDVFPARQTIAMFESR